MVETGFTDDIATAWAVSGDQLLSDPVANNLPLTLLTAHRDLHRDPARATPGSELGDRLRFWWAATGTTVTGVCFQIGARPCVVSARDRSTAAALAQAVAATVQDLPGVNGELAAATAFVGEWAAARHLAVRPGVLQTYYVLDGLTFQSRADRTDGTSRADRADSTDSADRRDRTDRAAHAPAGTLRLGRMEEADLLLEWAVGFQHDAFGPGPIDRPGLTATVHALIDRSQLWVWDTGRPVAMTSASPVIGGVTRIRGVYTPPAVRGNGHAAACVSGVVSTRLAAGATHCTLYADLANPTSNGIYRRLGFRPHSDHVDYEFD